MDWWKSFCVLPSAEPKDIDMISRVEYESELKRLLQSGEQGMYENFKDEVTTRATKTGTNTWRVCDYTDSSKISSVQTIPELLEIITPSVRTDIRCKNDAISWAQGWMRFFFKKYRVLLALEQLPVGLHVSLFHKIDQVEQACGIHTIRAWVDMLFVSLPNVDYSKRTRALTFVMSKYRKARTRVPKRAVYEHYVKSVRSPLLSEVEFENLIKKTKILSTSRVYDVYYASLVS